LRQLPRHGIVIGLRRHILLSLIFDGATLIFAIIHIVFRQIRLISRRCATPKFSASMIALPPHYAITPPHISLSPFHATPL